MSLFAIVTYRGQAGRPRCEICVSCCVFALVWFAALQRHYVSCVTSHVPRVVSESFGLPLDIHLLLIHDDVALMFDTTQHDMLIFKKLFAVLECYCRLLLLCYLLWRNCSSHVKHMQTSYTHTYTRVHFVVVSISFSHSLSAALRLC